MKGPLFCFASCMPNLLKWHLASSITNVWHMEMVRRGYAPTRSNREEFLPPPCVV